jgi:hypothetical protein
MNWEILIESRYTNFLIVYLIRWFRIYKGNSYNVVAKLLALFLVPAVQE